MSEREIVIQELGDEIRIRWAKPPRGGLGCLDEKTGTIYVDPEQPEVGQQIVLLHELLHLVDAMMVGAGVTKRRADHRWIESAAPNLLALLVCAGRWNGAAKDEVLRFMVESVGDPDGA